MSTFTLPFKKVIELTGGNVTYENMTFRGIPMGRIARLNGGNIGLAGMPIFDEEYRPIITGLIVDHFWNYDIGWETIDMFQMGMRRKLNEVMPYYNEMYKSTLMDFDPLSTFDITTETEQTGTEELNTSGSTAVDSDSTSKSRAVQSNTPQTQLAGHEDYATAGADSNSQTTVDSLTEQETISASESENKSLSRTRGYQAVPSSLILRYRETLINVNMAVINELEDQFMVVWDNGDTFTKGLYL